MPLRAFLIQPRERDVRQKIEAQIAELLRLYDAGSKVKTLEEKDQNDAAARRVITEIVVDTAMLFHGINEHLGRIAIALEKQNALPPAQHLFNQS